jgi:NADH-quinone oxidoreductase subunit J
MDWLADHWLDFLPLVLLAAGVWWLMPQTERRSKLVGLSLAIAGTALLAVRLQGDNRLDLETVLFWIFAGAAIVFATLMITSRNPVYSALWFALVTLNTCGLFLLRSAPFLAAATVIVYAGAIVVTFVFVIMLAQQSGATVYDQRARQPVVATIAAFVLLAMILGTLRQSRDEAPGEPQNFTRSAVVANPLSQPDPEKSLASMRALGRSLFGDYLFAVELAGTLLLVATIGAIAIAPRRRRGTL